jgi:fatty acyl-CoA reductase
LREKYGSSFRSFTREKISPLPGDIITENLGLESYQVLKLAEEIDVIVNGAATTNFYERCCSKNIVKLSHKGSSCHYASKD